MVCPNCGSAVESSDRECPNCGATLERSTDPRELEKKSRGLKQMTRELKAVGSDGPQRFESGDVIAGRFRVDEIIAGGPLGEVYRAHRDGGGDEGLVALKTFDPELVETSEERERFVRATRAMGTMTQPNVVRVYDSGIAADNGEELPWLSMEYLEGLTLRKALQLRAKKGQRFGLEELEAIVGRIVRALQHMGRAFPHGNLKPSNVFILPERVAVTDGFELSAFSAPKWRQRLKDSPYLAPELRSGEGKLSKRADVYSLGLIIEQMRFGDAADRGEVSVDIDVGIQTLCRRATAERAEDRYPSVEALSEDFQTLVDTGELMDESAEQTRIEPDPTTEETVRDPNVPPVVSGTSTVTEAASEPTHPSTGSPDQGNPAAAADASSGDGDGSGGAGSNASPPAGNGGGPSDDPAPHWVIGGVMIALVVVAIAVLQFDFGSEEPIEIVPADEIDAGAVAQRADAKPETMRFQEDELEASAGGGDAGAPDASAKESAKRAADADPEEDSDPTVVQREDEEASGGSGPPSTLDDDGPAGAAAGGSGGEKPAQGTDCPSGMALVKAGSGNYCIDRYEYPGKGQMPRVNVTWFGAQKLCEERQARLCTLNEFQRACGRKYPWGNDWDPDRCNTADADGFARQLQPTGSRQRCRSWPGTYDMVGNVAEWVEEQRIVGGGFDSGPQVATCRYVSKKAPGRGAPNVGFRCCAAPD